MSKHLSIVIPVRNEGASFPFFWARLSSQIPSDFTAFVVYDFEEDDTLPVVHNIMAQEGSKIRLIKNNIESGVVGAILSGFNQVEHGPILVVMADLSDDLGQVGRMLELYRKGYQVVVGSRYMKGGSIEGAPWFKQFLSRMAGLTLYWFRGIPTHDATNAFKIYDRDMLKSLKIESRRGFELNLEITVKAFLAGYRIAEVPSRWKERTHGKSHFKLWAWLPHYLKWYFYAYRPRQKLTSRAST